jgi:hypothetical protein
LVALTPSLLHPQRLRHFPSSFQLSAFASWKKKNINKK